MEDNILTPDLDLLLPGDAGSVSEARNAVRLLAREVGASEDDVSLAVSEAVANAVLHAFRGRTAGTVRVQAAPRNGMLLVSVGDDGGGMAHNSQSRGLGVGISLISRLANEVSFRSTGSGTTVLMTFETFGQPA